MTDEAGNVVAVVELDPWGGETDRCVNQRPQPYRYTTYERDGDGVDQALMRSYHGWWTRFNEPDPWEGSYDLSDPQSFNRYTYVQNDPVNFVDPTGLVSDEEEVIRIETRAPRWVDDFWLRHALGVLFGAGQRVRLWTEYEPRAGSRDSVPTLVQGQHNAQPQRPPCEEQDFNFSSGAGGFSAQELSAIAQTAVGDASTAVYSNEVEAVITTIVMYRQRCACGTDQFYGERSPGCTQDRARLHVC